MLPCKQCVWESQDEMIEMLDSLCTGIIISTMSMYSIQHCYYIRNLPFFVAWPCKSRTPNMYCRAFMWIFLCRNRTATATTMFPWVADWEDALHESPGWTSSNQSLYIDRALAHCSINHFSGRREISVCNAVAAHGVYAMVLWEWVLQVMACLNPNWGLANGQSHYMDVEILLLVLIRTSCTLWHNMGTSRA